MSPLSLLSPFCLLMSPHCLLIVSSVSFLSLCLHFVSAVIIPLSPISPKIFHYVPVTCQETGMRLFAECPWRYKLSRRSKSPAHPTYQMHRKYTILVPKNVTLTTKETSTSFRHRRKRAKQILLLTMVGAILRSQQPTIYCFPTSLRYGNCFITS